MIYSSLPAHTIGNRQLMLAYARLQTYGARATAACTPVQNYTFCLNVPRS